MDTSFIDAELASRGAAPTDAAASPHQATLGAIDGELSSRGVDPTTAPGAVSPPQPAGVAANAGAGANEGIAGFLGMPVDAMHWLMTHGPANLLSGDADAQRRAFAPPQSLSGLITGRQPEAPTPVGGSDSIKSLMGLIGADPRDIQPTNAPERLARGAGQGVASMVMPFGGARALSEAMPLAKAAPSLGRALVDQIASGSLAGNAALGGVSGLGGAAAEEAVPDQYAQFRPLANLLGQFGAGGLTVGTLAAGRAAGDFTKPYIAPFSADLREQAAAARLHNSASDPGALTAALDSSSAPEAGRLVVARKTPDGTVRYGQPGDTHGDLIGENENLPDNVNNQMGFAQPGGPFMTRKEAATFARDNGHATSDQTHPTYGLEASKYFSLDEMQGRSMQRLFGVSPKSPDAVPNQEIVPGSKPTTFQLTGDQGIGQLERAATLKNPEPFKARLEDQNAARLGALDSAAPSDAAPGAVGDAFKRQLAAIDATTQGVVSGAQGRAADAVNRLGGTLNDAQYGSGLRAEAQSALEKSNAREGALWRAIDPDNRLVVDSSQVSAAARDIGASVGPFADQPGAAETSIFQRAAQLSGPNRFNDLTDLRGATLKAIRDERQLNGSTPALRRMTMLQDAMDSTISGAAQAQADANPVAMTARVRDAASADAFHSGLVDDMQRWYSGRNADVASATPGSGGGRSEGRPGRGSQASSGVSGAAGEAPGGSQGIDRNQSLPGEAPLEPNFDQAAATRYRAATNATREQAQTFRSGPVDAVLKNGKAPLADEQVAKRFFNGGARGFADVNSFLKAAGGSDNAVALLKDYAASSLRSAAEKPDGTLDLRKFDKWMADHAPAMRVFPAVAERFETAAKAQGQLEGAAAIRKDAMDRYQNGAARHFLGEIDPRDAVKKALGSGDREAAFGELARLTAKDPAARAGLQRATVDLMQRDLVGNTEAGTSGAKQIKADQFQTFIKKNRGALGQVFSQDQLRSMAAIADDLARAKRSEGTKALAGDSGTEGNRIAVAKHSEGGGHASNLMQTLGLLLVEHHTGNLLVTAGSAVGAKLISVARSAGIGKIDDLVTTALLDPEAARLLLTKLKPNGKPDDFTMQLLRARLLKIGAGSAISARSR